MSVGLDVMVVLPLALYVHVTRVPVTVLRGRLRPPVCPDAELSVAKPIWHAVGHQGFARPLERPRLDWRNPLLRCVNPHAPERGNASSQKLEQSSPRY